MSARAGDRVRTVGANGIDIAYEDLGRGAPVVLLHGGLLTGRLQWGTHLPALTRRHRVLLPDTRGHGRTRDPAGRLDYPLLVEDAAAFIRALHLDRPAVVGWSDGGQVALELAVRHPDLVSTVVVGAAAHRFPPRYHRTVAAWVGPPDRPFDPDRLERDDPGGAAFVRRAQRAQGPGHWAELLGRIKPMWQDPPAISADRLRTAGTPVLLLLGDRDQFFDVPTVAELHGLLPHAHLAVLPGHDHHTALGATARRLVLDHLHRYPGRHERRDGPTGVEPRSPG